MAGSAPPDSRCRAGRRACQVAGRPDRSGRHPRPARPPRHACRSKASTAAWPPRLQAGLAGRPERDQRRPAAATACRALRCRPAFPAGRPGARARLAQTTPRSWRACGAAASLPGTCHPGLPSPVVLGWRGSRDPPGAPVPPNAAARGASRGPAGAAGPRLAGRPALSPGPRPVGGTGPGMGAGPAAGRAGPPGLVSWPRRGSGGPDAATSQGAEVVGDGGANEANGSGTRRTVSCGSPPSGMGAGSHGGPPGGVT